MILFPAIDIKDGRCVRLRQGDYQTAHQVAQDPVETACSFAKQGARWIHMVDLDGAKDGEMVNTKVFLEVARKSGLQVQLGGGIRNMEAVTYYLEHGINRVVLGSVALKNPALVKEAVKRYGRRIAVGIDAKEGYVATEGWLEKSDVSYLQLARLMESAGVSCLIFTDISRDGMLSGPNLEQLSALNAAVSCDIIASGGIKDLTDLQALQQLGLYGAICGKSLYQGTLDFQEGMKVAVGAPDDMLEKIRWNNGLVPAVVQQADSGEVLMLAYLNRESLAKTLETGYTWFFSRSRGCLWNKGESSGHTQKVVEIRLDCDYDTLLIKVQQNGPACHTGSHNCFYNVLEENVK